MESRLNRTKNKQLKNRLIISTLLVGVGALTVIGLSHKFLY